jgi:hypothetical protein
MRFFPILFMCCITFMNFPVLNHPCIHGIRLAWSWCMIFSMCYWIWFANILLRIFALMFIKEIGLLFSFLLCSYLVWLSK